MLQRAASNAYSWWWASHIRTKQSKWLEQNLQDMEEKVAYTLKLLQEDGDSFAKRAEMYYKKRPELIEIVEEFYRAYRALAERYDHISTELQNANNTIAAVCPDQVQFMQEDDEDASPRVIKRSDFQKGNIPNVPEAPLKNLKNVITTATRITSATKKLKPSESGKSRKAAAIVAKSGLTKDEGLEEIGKLQKKILALQTEKEFVKSSYEDKLEKYWDTENKIKEMQGRVYSLQDEFGAGIVIEDDEARTLMASTALKSCQETLTNLKEKHERSAEEAKVEQKRIKDTRDKSESIEDELPGNATSQKRPSTKDDSVKAVEGSTTQRREELEPSQEKIKEQPEVGSSESLTVQEMAEKIDELVNKVVSLDTAFSSQTSLIQRLRTETNELQTKIQILEGEKAMLINSKNELSSKLVMTEEDLQRLQGLKGNVKDQNNNLQTFSTEAHSPQFNADKLQILKPDEDLQHSSQKEDKSTVQGQLQETDGQEGVLNPNDVPKTLQNVKLLEEIEVKPSSEKDKTTKKEEMSAIQVKSQKDTDGQESEMNSNDGLQRRQSVKLPEESEVKPSSEKDKTPQKEEMSTIQIKSQKDIDGQESEMNSNDVLQRQQSVKLPEESEVKPLSEKDQTPQKEEMPTIQVKSQKEIDKQDGEMNSEDGLQRLQSVKLSEEHEVQNSSEKEKASPAKVQFQKQLEGSECAPKLADDNQQSEKLNGELKVSGAIQKEEKAIAIQTEVAKHTEEHDLSTIPGNQGDVSGQHQLNVDPCNLLEKSLDKMTQEKVDNQASAKAPDNSLNVEKKEQGTEPGGGPDGKKMLNGMENREKVLLTEYNKVLQNYVELKKKLDEEGIQMEENTSETKVQLEELRSANAKKDEEIRVLQEKLRILQAFTDNNNYLDDQCAEQKVTVSETPRTQPTVAEEDIKVIPVDQSQTSSAIEDKVRMSIDEVLEENLDFWLRFSTTFHQIQKFETEVKDLEAEVSKLQDRKKKQSDSSSIKYSLRSDMRPLFNHLREIQTELTLWMEKSTLLKEELTARFSSLCKIQEEIAGALRLSAEDNDFKFTSYQAAKFQGEVLNMKQENNKVADELQSGLDHVTILQIDLEKTLTSLSEEFGFSDKKIDPNIKLEHSDSRNRIPLRSFIFGVKPKKQKSSFLSSMHPALVKKYNGFRSGSNR